MSAGGGGERALCRRSLLAFGAALVCAACGGVGPGGASSPEAGHPLIGAPAPAFELPAVPRGGEQSLTAHAGKIVIVDFWATWCKPCKDSLPAYQKLVEQLGGALVVIGVSQDDDPKDIPAFMAETGAKFPVVWDDGKVVAKSYDPPSMPTAFVVDRTGIVRFVHVGYHAGDEATLESEVRALLR